MDSKTLLKSIFFLSFLGSVPLMGQYKKEILRTDFFSKGNFLFSSSNRMDLEWNKIKPANGDPYNSNNFDLNIGGTYFISDKIGMGINISAEKDTDKDDDISDITSTVIGSAHAMYGQSLGGVINVYGKATVRGGWDKDKYKSASFSQEYKDNEFGVNLEFGAPLAFGGIEGLYFTPYISYDYSVSKDEDYKDSYSGIYLGTRMNISLPSASYARNGEDVRRFSGEMYTHGTNVLGGSTNLFLNFGTHNDKYIGENTDVDYKSGIYGANVRVEYYNFVADNIALGGELRIGTSGSKSRDEDDENSSFSWMAKPKLMVNLPVESELNNTFCFVGYGVGWAVNKGTSSGVDFEQEESRSRFTVGAGYNLFVAGGLAFVPVLEYGWNTSKDSETNEKFRTNSLELSFSFRHSF